MKKITLLLTVALSIHALNGMETNLERELSTSGNIAAETKTIITQAISSSDNLDDIINAIDTHTDKHDLKEFTTLVHLLSDKFPNIATETIAQKFTTPIAAKYIELGKNLLFKAGTKTVNTLNEMEQMIADDADIDFTLLFTFNEKTGEHHTLTPFFFACQMANYEAITLLLTTGLKEKTMLTANTMITKVLNARAANGTQF